MTVLEFSMFPLGKGESVGNFVAQSIDIIDKSGVNYQLNAMGTVMEGEWDALMAVVKQCHERMQQDCDRIETIIKIDYRKKATRALDSKIASVEKRLGRTVNK